VREGVEHQPDFTQGRAPTVTTRVIKRDMLPADLIGVAIYLAGADRAFMSGQLLNVDGGRTTVPPQAGRVTPEILAQIPMRRSCSAGS
jgi:hypothetical protein